MSSKTLFEIKFQTINKYMFTNTEFVESQI